MSEAPEPAQNAQSSQIVRTTPLAQALKKAKASFLKSLRANGGNVSQALKASKLARRTAYDEFKRDPEFAEGWLDAIERAGDELMKEATNRATKGGSDRLLIFLLEKHERTKTRQKLYQTAMLAVNAVRTAGQAQKLTEDQITAIQREIVTELEKVSLT